MVIEFAPIGIIHTPHKQRDGMPIQPPGAAGMHGTVEVFEEYQAGLKDLDGFSHIILLYHFHEAGDSTLLVTPFMDTEPRGLFSTRAPKRPNAIGLSVVRLVSVEGGQLEVESVDMLDRTPLLDIKPYVPEFDSPPAVRTGWLEHVRKTVSERRSDNRFE